MPRPRPPRRVALLVGLAWLLVSSPAAADLTGRWHVESSGAEPFAEVVQSGSAVTIAMTVSGFPLVFDGSVSGNTLSASSDDGPCPVSLSMKILPGDAVMDGISAVFGGPCTTPSKSRAFMTLCDCYDTNQISGDGCDAECRIEPCFVCTGEPSVCAPAGDGTACDDRRDCTTGETCSSGVCGGGSPVAPCVDLTGRWLRIASSDFGVVQVTADISQRDGIVVFREPPSGTLRMVGTVDPPTAAMSLEAPSTLLLCSDPATFTGTAAPDGRSYGGSGTSVTATPHVCSTFSYTEEAFRCGGGTLDPGEACDDGNRTSGDGCDDACQVEACFACAGEPSSCTPQSSTPCDDGDPCTTGDVCDTGSCIGAPVICGPCSTCDNTGTCIEAPRNDCSGSLDPSKSRLQVTDKALDKRDSLKWRWRVGIATGSGDFGYPIWTDAVATCLYDESGPTPSLLFRAVVPPGGICGSRPCWKVLGSGGFRFRSKTGVDGIVGLSLRPGTDGKARVDVNGAGIGLSGRPLGLPAPPLSVPLRMQVQVEGGGCFEVEHGAAGVIKNDLGSFKGRGTP